MLKRTATTKDVSLLRQLHLEGQLRLAPEFQRNAVWPRAAKAYLIDTILCERPMPLFFFQRGRSAQTGKPSYAVVDGQQRLRAIFDFMDDRFRLTQSKDKRFKGKKFSELHTDLQDAINNYDLTVEELTGYTDAQIRDIFDRMNRYVVKLSPQEIRHARQHGRFFDFIESLARLPFWKDQRVLTKKQLARMRASEFAAELVILLVEGPQDKKSSVDLYYGRYQKKFPNESEVKERLQGHFNWILAALPGLAQSRFRKPTDFYSLVGAVDRLTRGDEHTRRSDAKKAGERLVAFEKDISSKEPSRTALAYLAAASRQTDNIAPRTTRIETLMNILSGK
jgi:hypothetical protein